MLHINLLCFRQLKAKRLITGVYEIKNIVDGRRYVGSAINIFRRWQKHKDPLRKNKHYNLKLQRAWNKYGESSFVFSVLLWCSKENLIRYEQLCIDGLNTYHDGYNAAPLAGSCLGAKWDKEKLRFGSRNPMYGNTRYSGEGNPMFGRPSANRGISPSTTTIEKRSVSMTLYCKMHPGSRAGFNNGMFGKRGEACPTYGRKQSEAEKKMRGEAQVQRHLREKCKKALLYNLFI